MKKTHTNTKRALVMMAFALSPLAAGCLTPLDEQAPYDGEFSLSTDDPLFANAPPNDSLPDEDKADYPAVSTGLLAFQSPVRSQGSRGLCSIFSAVALMEHLYIKEGTITDPDFSEQYLQWSTKFLLKVFTHTEGSNTEDNLAAIDKFGLVGEAAWPYESKGWTSQQDAACTGNARPTHCYTNGKPSANTMLSPKFRLPRGRWINTNSIKSHITRKGTGVVVSVKFFYQAWNHPASAFTTNRASWEAGYVTYPNEHDIDTSLERPSGHSVLVVGWDDKVEAPLYDRWGQPVLDGAGKPVMEKGFYIFKNSWGTGRFGVKNPHGDGYGYLSMRYVKEYGNAYVSDLPKVTL